jgi:hypothetical protein
MTTNVYLKAKIEERTSQAQVLANLQQTAVDAQRDLTDDERRTFDAITKRLGFLDEEIARIVAAEESAQKFVQVYGAHTQASAQAERARRDAQARYAMAGLEERGQFRTWGERFTESRAFQAFREGGGHGSSAGFVIEGDWIGGLPGRFDTPREIEERQTPGTVQPTGPSHTFGDQTGEFGWAVGKNVMATSASTGDPSALQSAMTWRGPTQPAERFPLMAVIGRVPTSAGSVEYYYWMPGEDMAGVVPEGDLKPEASLAGAERAAPIETYAWWKGVTRQALDDIPMIRSIIDGYLRQGVIRRINYQVAAALAGDTHIPGAGAAGQSLFAVIRLAMAQVDAAGYAANAVLLNPFDWAAIDVLMWTLTGGTGDISRAFWGLTPVALSGLPSGSAYVGDMREAVTYFDRQRTNVLVTDSHGDYFIRNKLVVLAEARGLGAVTNAAALVKCEGDVPDLEALMAGGNGAGIEGAAARRAVRASGARRPAE